MLSDTYRQLENHSGYETITDSHGHVWCIANDGRSAATRFAPVNVKCKWNWDSARTLGCHVDLALNPGRYEKSSDGPCHAEVHAYLRERLSWNEAELTEQQSISPTITTVEELLRVHRR